VVELYREVTIGYNPIHVGAHAHRHARREDKAAAAMGRNIISVQAGLLHPGFPYVGLLS
jgi:hypothetical protein